MSQEPDDSKLRGYLRVAKPSPTLPPRFTQRVWQRIEMAEARGESITRPTWLESLIVQLLRPRFAFATAAVLVIAGALSGAYVGNDFVRNEAQARYIAAVAPSILH